MERSRRADRCWLLLALRKPGLSLAEVDGVLAADPFDPVARTLRALCLVSLGKGDEALIEARAAASFAPDWGGAHAALAWVQLRRGKPIQALEAIRQAQMLEPERAEHRVLAAWIHGGLGDHKAMLAAAEEAARLDPRSLDAHDARASALRELGRFDEAAAAAREALACCAQDPFALALLGWLHLGKDEEEPSRRCFQEALRLDPGYEFAGSGLAAAASHGRLLGLRIPDWLRRLCRAYDRLTRPLPAILPDSVARPAAQSPFDYAGALHSLALTALFFMSILSGIAMGALDSRHRRGRPYGDYSRLPPSTLLDRELRLAASQRFNRAQAAAALRAYGVAVVYPEAAQTGRRGR